MAPTTPMDEATRAAPHEDVAPTSNLFRIRRIFALSPHGGDGGGASRESRIQAMAVHTQDASQMLALAIASQPTDAAQSNYLLLRSIAADQRVRFWRFPLAASHAKQQAERTEFLVSLEFSPEGDWLACLSSRKNRLHLLPVAVLVDQQKRTQLARMYQPAHNREWMSVRPSVMTAQMASYLRATNETGGLNGARYHSRVAGDDEQMSTLEFALGMGTVTCCRWWRSMNGRNYLLVGGSENIISMVNAEENAEECRCELQHAGTIESIDLVYEKFRKEKRTSMLVRTRVGDGDKAATKYFRVVLEKKTLVAPTAATAAAAAAATTTATATAQRLKQSMSLGSERALPSMSGTESSVETTMTHGAGTGMGVIHPSMPSGERGSQAAAGAAQYVIKTFPAHFVQDMDFRPQRIKKNTPQIRLYAINGMLSSESSLALFDPESRHVSVFSNFQWKTKAQYHVPDLFVNPSAEGKFIEMEAPHNTGENQGHAAADLMATTSTTVENVELSYCSSDLMLLQGTSAVSESEPADGSTPSSPRSSATTVHQPVTRNVSTWVSLPSRQLGFEEETSEQEAHVVHYLSLHDNERVERVLQTTAQSDPNDGAAELIYVLQTAHNVYECRPQWSRLALFRALCTQSIPLRDALSIGYALGIDMASLCEVVADTLCADIAKGISRGDERVTQWVHSLLDVSRVMPSKAINQLTAIDRGHTSTGAPGDVDDSSSPNTIHVAASAGSGRHGSTGMLHAIAYGKRVLARTRDEDKDELTSHEHPIVALQVVNLILQHQARHSFDTDGPDRMLRPRIAEIQSQLDQNEAWLHDFLATSHTFDTVAMVKLCLSHHQVDKAVYVGIHRQSVPFVLDRLVELDLSASLSPQCVNALIDAQAASELLKPSTRILLRGLSIELQVELLLSHTEAVLEHRDWITRQINTIPLALCERLAAVLDPQRGGSPPTTPPQSLSSGEAATARHQMPDVASSEFMAVAPEERIELFLTLLLRINHAARNGVDDKQHPYASQQHLEILLNKLAYSYRPPIMIARCVDFGNWSAAACLHQAHGELVDAVECRLHGHHVRRFRGHRGRRRQWSFQTIATPAGQYDDSKQHEEYSDSDSSDDDRDNDPSLLGTDSHDRNSPAELRTELVQLLDTLVVRTAVQITTPSATPSPVKPQSDDDRNNPGTVEAEIAAASTPAVAMARTMARQAISEHTRGAILARILVKWFEYGLSRTDLEAHLQDANVFSHVAAPLARIFFSEIMDKVAGGSPIGTSGTVMKGSVAPMLEVAASDNNAGDGGFDERDKDWVRKCHALPFSGAFLFHVCMWFLKQTDASALASKETVPTMQRRELLDVVTENISKNDLQKHVVLIAPHAANALGKSDPLETHVKVFTCGHLFPKRVFEEDVLPEFEKRMNALPVPLFTTKQVLLAEFKRSHVEAPCPVCAFNKISALIDKQVRDAAATARANAAATLAADTKSMTNNRNTPRKPLPSRRGRGRGPPSYYFLHHRTMMRPPEPPGGGANRKQGQSKGLSTQWSSPVTHHARGHQVDFQHEPWEWKIAP